jgi:hypothetical protein
MASSILLRIPMVLIITYWVVIPLTMAEQPTTDGWIPLFDGRSLDGWKVNERPESFRVVDGAIVAHGERSHLFYVGDVENHDFKNFELKLEVMTEPQANSGVYFHTKFQGPGWPKAGYECQVNNSQSDWKRTGSLYDVKDVREAPAKDNQWFEYHIMVRGKHVTLSVDGKTLVDYTETENPPHLSVWPLRKLSSGTFAFQAHDPDSVVHYRNIRVKPLP